MRWICQKFSAWKIAFASRLAPTLDLRTYCTGKKFKNNKLCA